MPRFKLPGAFLILLAATFCLWQFRFARDPRHPTLTLSDLKSSSTLSPGAGWVATATQPGLLLRPIEPARPVIQRFSLPSLAPTDWLHLRFQLIASQLQPGPEPWSDGRLILEWHSNGSECEFDPIGSVRGNRDTGVVSVVAQPNRGPATPTLRLESLAQTGDFQILALDTTLVHERALWKLGQWPLLLAWAAWFVSAAGRPAHPTCLRRLMAASVWLFMAVTFSFPGPWNTLRPLTSQFEIGPNPSLSASLPTSLAPPPPTPACELPPTLSAGSIPPQGGILVQLKAFINRHFAALKPLYHIPLLFAPSLVSLCLISRRRTLLLATMTSLAIEAAQLAFGYSLDWLDALDVLCDALGILLAWRLWHWLNKNRSRGKCSEKLKN